MNAPHNHCYERAPHPRRKRALAVLGKAAFAFTAALTLSDYLFAKPDLVAGNYARLTNRLAASRKQGVQSEAIPSRMGATRYYDRSNAPPLPGLTGSVAHAWDGGNLQCPLGRYQAELVPPNGRLGIETPLLEPRKSCEKCPRGRFGDAVGLTAVSACSTCPPGRFGVFAGGTSMNEACESCPAGTYGSERGLTTQSCSGECPAGNLTFRPTKCTRTCTCLRMRFSASSAYVFTLLFMLSALPLFLL